MWNKIVKAPNMDGLARKPDLLSFHIASKMPVSESTRQELLEIDGVSYSMHGQSLIAPLVKPKWVGSLVLQQNRTSRSESLYRSRHNRTSEMIKEQPAASRSDYGRKNSSQEASVHNTARSSTAISSHTAPNRYRSQSASNARQEDENSASETLQMHQEEQDLVNMMASSRVHSLDGHYQMPIKFASSHMPVPFSMLVWFM